jgi:hypothetical protein
MTSLVIGIVYFVCHLGPHMPSESPREAVHSDELKGGSVGLRAREWRPAGPLATRTTAANAS